MTATIPGPPFSTKIQLSPHISLWLFYVSSYVDCGSTPARPVSGLPVESGPRNLSWKMSSHQVILILLDYTFKGLMIEEDWSGHTTSRTSPSKMTVEICKGEIKITLRKDILICFIATLHIHLLFNLIFKKKIKYETIN